MEIREGLTFDDVLLQPRASEILPADARLNTRLTRDISINVPLISAAMDTVTEASLAIVMAQIGGIGVIHRNLTIEEQAEEVATTPSSVELVSVGSNVTQFIEDRVTIKKEAAKTVNKDNKKTALCDG